MTIEVESIEIEALKAALRRAVANYMQSEGCSCCRGQSHDDDAAVIAELLDVPPYEDGSGYAFLQFATD